MLIDEQVLREVILHLLYVGGRGKKMLTRSLALSRALSLSQEKKQNVEGRKQERTNGAVFW